MADVDNMRALYPELFDTLVNEIRHEPLCNAHYFVSEFQLDDTAGMVNMCDSLRVPKEQEKVRMQVYDLTSAMWVPIAETKEEVNAQAGRTIKVTFKKGLVQTGHATHIHVEPSLTRSWTAKEAVTSPEMLRRFLKSNKIRIWLHFDLQLPNLKSSSKPDKGIKDAMKAAMKAAIECATKEKSVGDVVHQKAMQLKLVALSERIQNRVFGKHLVVVNRKCLGVYAKYFENEKKKMGHEKLEILQLGRLSTGSDAILATDDEAKARASVAKLQQWKKQIAGSRHPGSQAPKSLYRDFKIPPQVVVSDDPNTFAAFVEECPPQILRRCHIFS